MHCSKEDGYYVPEGPHNVAASLAEKADDMGKESLDREKANVLSSAQAVRITLAVPQKVMALHSLP